MSQNAGPSVPSSLTPIRCTTAGTSIVPLEPLAAQPVSLAHAHNSTRLRDSVRQATSQVQRRSRDCVGSSERTCLARGDCCPSGKDAIEPVPPAKMRQGFYSPYFIVPKKGGGLRPILDCDSWTGPCTDSRSRCWCTGAWSNAYSPGIGLQRSTWRMLAFMFRSFRNTDRSYGLRPRVGHGSTGSSPSGSPCPPVSSRRSRRAPLPHYGKWASGSSTVSSMARAREQLCDHRDLVLRHLSQLGLRVNWEKSKLSPAQRISFLGVELDSVSMTARPTEECAQSVLNCLSSFRGRTVVPLKQFQRLLGHMASAAAVTPLGFRHMRPLQHWLHSQVPRWAWRRGALWVNITQECRRSFSPWTDLAFLRAGVPLEQVSRHVVVTTDASSTGWGATCNGQAASGLWMGPRLLWHINCLELLAVHLALRQFGHCC